MIIIALSSSTLLPIQDSVSSGTNSFKTTAMASKSRIREFDYRNISAGHSSDDENACRFSLGIISYNIANEDNEC